VKVQVLLNQQSSDINQGVDQESGEIGAGDQGIMFGFASAETADFMPAAITYARMLCDKVYNYALKHNQLCRFLSTKGMRSVRSNTETKYGGY
jgi:S-adenosylmethionine synthetase